MKIEDLKEIWAVSDTEADQTMMDSFQIHQLLQSRAHTATARIKQNINRELIVFIALIGGGMIGIVRYKSSVFNIEMVLMSLFFAIGLYFYRQKQKALLAADIHELSLKDHLIYLNKTMERYMNLYVVTSAVFVPLLGGAGMFYGLVVNAETTHISLNQISPQNWGWISFAVGAYGLTAAVASRWYIKKMYGQYVHELQTCLDELLAENLED